jgi:predicted metal-dependent phosphoesterase TrpH
MSDSRFSADLHSHSTASDGSLTPTELVRLASEIGLRALAVTDHDTIGGLAEARAATRSLGLELIDGVELSVEDNDGRFHMLGYCFDPNSAEMADTLVDLRERRRRRNEKIIQRAHEIGLEITWDDILKHVGEDDEVVGRPHFAEALVENGYASSVQDAFDRFLASGQPLYFPKNGLSSRDAIGLIHRAGGVAVMAHPSLTKWADPPVLEARLAYLKNEMGLDGVEARYNKHTLAQTESYLQIASRLELLVTGGSDFHGSPKPTVRLGDVTAGAPAPYELAAALREHRPPKEARIRREKS